MTLQEYLTAEDYTPTSFAMELGVAPSTITRILKGERKPGLILALKIAALTDDKVGLSEFAGSAA